MECFIIVYVELIQDNLVHFPYYSSRPNRYLEISTNTNRSVSNVQLTKYQFYSKNNEKESNEYNPNCLSSLKDPSLPLGNYLVFRGLFHIAIGRHFIGVSHCLQECTGSICLAYGLESCQCIAGPDDPPTKSCELCCKLPGEDQPCLWETIASTIRANVPLVSISSSSRGTFTGNE